ncbi:hypothetical protein AB1Y20_011265 [Prymnesium parvum]|uniref:PHD-type domain-containing protein n=1 Tax=Prymnesium parvum TaxID=97485 RepID=A0AB34INT7_PRYPA
MLLLAGRPDEAKAHSAAFKGFKMLCDVLLPELRSRSHLYNLIYRHRSNCSLVLLKSEAVLGGATFRLIHDTGASAVLLEVLLLGVDQRQGVCGRGHGTRIVNVLKAIVLRHANEQCARPLLLTQADLGLSARAFWARQQLVEGPHAEKAVRDLHSWNKSNIVYDYTVPMMMEVPNKSWQCSMQESVRAQALPDQACLLPFSQPSDDDDDGEHPTGKSGTRCALCGRADGLSLLLQCDMCSRWCHVSCKLAAAGEAESAPPDDFTCSECAELIPGVQSLLQLSSGSRHDANTRAAPAVTESSQVACDFSASERTHDNSIESSPAASALQSNDRLEETHEAAHRTYSSNSATFRSPFGAPLPRKRPRAAAENPATERTWPQRGLRSESGPPAGSALMQNSHSSRKFGILTAKRTCASGGLLCRDSILAQWRLLLGAIIHEQRRLHAQRAPPQRRPIHNGRGPSTSHGRGGRGEVKTPTAVGKGPHHDESDQSRSADRLLGLRSGPGSDVQDSAHARAVAIWKRIQMEDSNRIHNKFGTQISKPSKASASAAEDTTAAAAAWKAFDRIVERHQAQERKRREDEARDIVRRVHSAIAIDVTQRSPRARLHILPELGSISRSPLMVRFSHIPALCI